MNLCYFDVNITFGEDLQISPKVEKTMGILHGYMRQSKTNLPIAFPKIKGKSLGNIIRVFANDFGKLDECKEAIRQHIFIRDYTAFSTIKTVDDVSGDGVAYLRKRAPHERKKFKEFHGDDYKDHRIETTMPNFTVENKKGGDSYTIFLEVKKGDCSIDDMEQVNSFGLSTVSKPVFLPVI